MRGLRALLVGLLALTAKPKPSLAQGIINLAPFMDGPAGYLDAATDETTPALHSSPCGGGDGRETVYFLALQPGWG